MKLQSLKTNVDPMINEVFTRNSNQTTHKQFKFLLNSLFVIYLLKKVECLSKMFSPLYLSFFSFHSFNSVEILIFSFSYSFWKYILYLLPQVHFRRILNSVHSNRPNQSMKMFQLHCFDEQHASLHVLLDLNQRWSHLKWEEEKEKN